ncbi:cell division protein FtsL [Bordetella sp. N]|uniref:cell division protein FtsL n=1 Tax=Bordetella sp. N TaxID=1746199 RepID=UPI00070B9EF9|nr:cell division protein FtsL [Bordetella sp. N]ALM86374.1 cell division protein FtsL [Bordetella sp. N]
MGRVSLVLAMVLMLCAISLVTSRYQSRQLFVDVDRAQAQARDLENDWRRLQLDRAELARSARVDHAAREDLKMISIVPNRTIYLNQPPVPVSGGAQ